MKPDITKAQYKNAISVEQMRKSDEYTIKHLTSSKTLMYRAAMGIYKSYDYNNKKIAIVTGSGNNGGDGYALASILADNDILPDIYRVSDKFSDDGRHFYLLAKDKGVYDEIFSINSDLSQYDVIVDCILGTGFKGEPKDNIKTVIEKINSSNSFVISADINSGLDGDTGLFHTAVKSDLTVSIGYYKKGLFLSDAPSIIGDLVNIDIGIELIKE